MKTSEDSYTTCGDSYDEDRFSPEGTDHRVGDINLPEELLHTDSALTIPRCTDEPTQQGFDRAAYRERNRAERLVNRLKQYRALAARYEELAVTFHVLLTIAAISSGSRFANTP
jgi:hypothetical protein